MKKLFILFCIFLFSCQNEYIQFHNEKLQEDGKNNQINDFSFEKIKYLSGLTMQTTPNVQLLDEIASKIDKAKTRIYVEVYIFTEKRMKKALVDAKKRGLDVKVLLEKNVYLANNLNTSTFKELQKNGIEVKYSHVENYALNHSKMMIIDDEVMISTGNYSYSSFKYNREFFLFLKNTEIFPSFLEIFQADFDGKKKNISQDNLVLSPFSSRFKLEYLLKNAKKSIQMYAHNFSDQNISDILIQKHSQGVHIQMIFPDLKKVASNKEEITILQNSKIDLKIINTPEIHAKAILIDEKYLYIGSENFSPSSLDKNREIGLLINNTEIINDFIHTFKGDFEK